MQVESELEMARKKIDDITKRIETTRIGPRKRNDSLRRKFTGPQLHAPQRSREVHEDRGRTISRDCQFFNNRLTKKMPVLQDDFRTALQQASNHVRTLSTLARSGTLSPTSLASTSTTPSPPNEADLSRPRKDAMNQLITVLQRNLRVRYELSLSEVIQV